MQTAQYIITIPHSTNAKDLTITLACLLATAPWDRQCKFYHNSVLYQWKGSHHNSTFIFSLQHLKMSSRKFQSVSQTLPVEMTMPELWLWMCLLATTPWDTHQQTRFYQKKDHTITLSLLATTPQNRSYAIPPTNGHSIMQPSSLGNNLGSTKLHATSWFLPDSRDGESGRNQDFAWSFVLPPFSNTWYSTKFHCSSL